jgi:hypothetical protein
MSSFSHRFLRTCLVSVVALAASSASADFHFPTWSCLSLFHESPDFNFAKFDVARAEWGTIVKDGDALPSMENMVAHSKGAEDVLAYVEAVAEKSGSDLFDMHMIYAKDPKRADRLVAKLIKDFDNGDLFSETSVRSLVAELYSVSNHGEVVGWRNLLPVTMDAAIEARVLPAMERDTLGEAFREIGFLKNQNDLEKVRRWVDDHQYVQDLALITAAQAFSFRFRGTYSKVGHFHPLGWRSIPKDWFKIYREKGAPGIEPLFKARFGRLGKGDYAWRYTAHFLGLALMGYTVYSIVRDPESVWDKVLWAKFEAQGAFTHLSPAALQKYADEHFDCDRERSKAESSWKKTYAALKHAELTSERDPEEWAQLKLKVLDAACSELRAQYNR